MTRVAIAAGGTGGHIVPAVAVARELLDQGVDVTWLGSGGPLEQRLLEGLRCTHHVTPVVSPRGGIVGMARSARVLWRAVWKTVGLLRSQRPQALLGMGGFASWPGGLAARLLRIPLVLHEQNAVAGMANRVLAPLASAICTGFPGTFAERSAASRQFTGNPVPAAIRRVGQVPVPRSSGGALRILVLGGSQGAEILNRVVPGGLSLLAQAGVDLTVLHQCGATAESRVAADYARFEVPAEVCPFIDDMATAYSGADLVIARAGALTVAELCVAGRAALLVPYPHATDDHQAANAAYLAEQGAALVLPQVALTEGRLAEQLAELVDSDRLGDLAGRARALAQPEAARRVAEHCLRWTHHA